MSNPLPVIFLAFANERDDYSRFLRALSKEQQMLQAAMQPALEQGICTLKVLPNATIDRIVQVFQQYRNRIVIFHYGGHADGYQLLLETAAGTNEVARGEGLVAFFALQKGLKLVFLNGCSTHQQAAELARAGVPLVVGTDNAIEDNFAAILAKEFYQSFGHGNSLIRAWDEALATLKVRHSEAELKNMFRPGSKSPLLHFHYAPRISQYPWTLHQHLPKKTQHHWSLLDVDPLFGLGLPKTYYEHLPESPYKGLAYFREKDAPIFFGRGIQIRALYDRLAKAEPLILFYGKSGVGKSSLLFAGLKPRIQDEYEVVYVRRQQALGLSGSMRQGLEQCAQTLSLSPEQAAEGRLLPPVLQLWETIEQASQSGKPLLMILDQVEECFTRPISRQEETDSFHELTHFLKLIQPLFDTGLHQIRGRLLLSFRKEYYVEIKQAIEEMQLTFSEVLLNRLDRRGIIEAVAGVAQMPRLSAHYQLQLAEKDNLPVIMADDLEADSESSIAPILQIMLRKLWDLEVGDKGRQAAKVFSKARYQAEVSHSMEDFYREQMEILQAQFPAEVHAGLVLDILFQHTTHIGTASSCRRSWLEKRYEVPVSKLYQLLRHMAGLSLLVIIDTSRENYTTLLAHDTLAPVVRRTYNDSDQPGQRASRILQTKMQQVSYQLTAADRDALLPALGPETTPALAPAKGQVFKGIERFMLFLRQQLPQEKLEEHTPFILEKTTTDFDSLLDKKTILLNEADIRLVKEGKTGMRRWTQREQRLLGRSEEEVERRKKELQDALDKAQFNLARAFEEKATTALEHAEKEQDTRSLQKAWLYSLEALNKEIPRDKHLPLSINRYVQTHLPTGPFRKLWATPSYKGMLCMTLAMSGDGRRIATSIDGEIQLWEVESGSLLHRIPDLEFNTVFLGLNHEGSKLVAITIRFTSQAYLRAWDLTRPDQPPRMQELNDLYTCACLHPGGEVLTFSCLGGGIRHWDTQSGDFLESLAPNSASGLAVSADGAYLAAGQDDGSISLWQLETKTAVQLSPPLGAFQAVEHLLFLPTAQADVHFLLAGIPKQLEGTASFILRCFEIRSGKLEKTTDLAHPGKVTALCAFPQPVAREEMAFLSGSDDQQVYVWKNLQPQPFCPYPGHGGTVSHICLNARATLMATLAEDHGMRLWKLTDERATPIAITTSHYLGITEVALRPRAGLALSYAGEHAFGSIRLWNIHSGALQAVLPGHFLSLSDDASLMAFRNRAGQLCMLHLPEMKVIHRLAHIEDTGLLIHPQNSCIAYTLEDDQQLCLWDLEENKQVVQLPDGILTRAFIQHGKELAWLTEKGALCRLEVMQNKAPAVLQLESFPEKVADAAISQHGKLLAVLPYSDRTIRIWNLEGKLLHNIPFEQDPSYMSIDLSPDGRLLALRHLDHIALYDLADAPSEVAVKLIEFDEAHHNHVRCMAFSPDSRLLATASRNVCIWNLVQGSTRREFFVEEMTDAMAFHPQGHLLAVTEQEHIRLWDPHTQQPLSRLSAHTGRVGELCVSAQGVLASAGEDQCIHLWDMQQEKLLKSLTGLQEDIHTLAFSADGQWLAYGGKVGYVWKWKAEREPFFTLTAHQEAVSALAFDPGGEFLASGDFDGTIYLTYWEDTHQNRMLKGHEGGISGLLVHDQHLISCSSDGSIRIWHLQSDTPPTVLQAHTQTISGIRLSADGQVLISCAKDSLIRFWRFPGGEELHLMQDENPTGITAMAMHPQGRLLAYANVEGNYLKFIQLHLLQDYLLQGPRANSFQQIYAGSFEQLGYQLQEIDLVAHIPDPFLSPLNGHSFAPHGPDRRLQPMRRPEDDPLSWLIKANSPS